MWLLLFSVYFHVICLAAARVRTYFTELHQQQQQQQLQATYLVQYVTDSLQKYTQHAAYVQVRSFVHAACIALVRAFSLNQNKQN